MKTEPKFEVNDWGFHYEAGLSCTIIKQYKVAGDRWAYVIKYSNDAICHVDESDLFSRTELDEARRSRSEFDTGKCSGSLDDLRR